MVGRIVFWIQEAWRFSMGLEGLGGNLSPGVCAYSMRQLACAWSPRHLFNLCPPLGCSCRVHPLHVNSAGFCYCSSPGLSWETFTFFDCLKFCFDLILELIFKSDQNTISVVCTVLLRGRKSDGLLFRVSIFFFVCLFDFVFKYIYIRLVPESIKMRLGLIYM